MVGNLDRYPPPGRLVKVNNHRLHINCMGEGVPTVVFESGQAGFSLDWMRVEPEVARLTRTCTYDRAGLGWSESGSQPRTPQQIVSELHTLLTNTNIPKPYVLVAHSLGGRYVRLYAHQYPDEVVGMVLVDPYSEAYDAALGEERLKVFMSGRAKQYRFLDTLARLGIVRLFGKQLIGMLGPDFRFMASNERDRYARLVTRPGAIATTISEYEKAVAANTDFQALVFPKNIPLRVLTHGIPWPYADYERIWQETQHKVAALSSDSELLVAAKSGHTIMMAQPELVVEAIRHVVEKVRNN